MFETTNFRFDLKKSVQAAAYLIQKSERKSLHYKVLLKLLYNADLYYFDHFNDFITGAIFSLTPLGIVPREICEQILYVKKEMKCSYWYEFLSLVVSERINKHLWLKNGCNTQEWIKVLVDPGLDELSDLDLQMLDQSLSMHEKGESYSWLSGLFDKYDDNFEESKTYFGSFYFVDLSIDQISEALGKSAEDKEEILAKIQFEKFLYEVLF